MSTFELRDIPLGEIQINELNVRQPGNDNGIEELAESIENVGLLQPIVLKGEFGKPPYFVIIGQRRFKAHIFLAKNNSAFSTIKAIIREDIDDVFSIVLSLTENLQREELNLADKSKGISFLFSQYGRDIKSVAKALSISEPSVREYLGIEEQATEKVLKFWHEGKILKEDVKRIISASQGDPIKADEIADKISTLTKYQKTNLVNIAKIKPELNSTELLEASKKQAYTESIVVNLPYNLIEPVTKAKEDLSMEDQDLLLLALTHWLLVNNYTKK